MSKSFNDKIESIRSEFIHSLPSRLAKIQNYITALSTEWNRDEAAKLGQELHNLRGVSGGHGLAALTQKAENIEAILENKKDRTNLSTHEQQLLEQAMNELIARSDAIRNSFDNTETSRTVENVSTSKAPLLLIVDDDRHFCDMVSVQMEHLGYRTRSINTLEDLANSITTYKPNAIFMDIIFNENRDAGTQIISAIREKEEINCPIIFMSARDDIEARSNAVRSGGVAFLSKTFNLGDLKNILDLIVPLQHAKTYKVLIIDDDKISASYCSAILQHAGIQVAILDNPERVFEYIINFDPDVILMDMYMPKLTGMEIASIVKQHQSFASIPIVIMSGETDLNKQFKMRASGADDFILKPFKPHHLSEVILNRIQRARQTQHLIYTDGLTGLMLFSKIKDQIVNLLDSCIRYNLDFSLARIDLDYFKEINDTYGHLSGDQILRNFAEFLLSRVRKSDIVTRSGGEEFTIIFPYTNSANAVRALNSFREAYAERTQYVNNTEIKVTFSAGIASIASHHDLESLLAAADHALYRAKESGRNNNQLST